MNQLSEVPAETERSLFRLRLISIESSSAREVILSSVSEVEHAVDTFVLSNVNRYSHRQNEIGTFFIERHLSEYLMSWSNRFTLLSELFDVSNSGEVVGQNFRKLLEVRNALMHGNGSMTSVQTGNFGKCTSLMRDLNSLFGVEFRGRELILDSVDRGRVFDVSSRYLMSIHGIG